MKARERALQILLSVEEHGSFVQDLLATAKAAPDYALLTELVKGSLQWRSKLDAEITRHLRGNLSELPAPIRALLRLGAYQIRFLSKIPVEVSVNETVELAKKYGHPGTVKLINAVLRQLLRTPRTEVEAALSGAEEIAEQLSHPLWVVKRWCENFGIEQTVALCRYNNSRWPLVIRVNSLRSTPEKLIDALMVEGARVSRPQYHPECLVLEELPAGKLLGELTSFRSGLFQAQDESAAFAATIAAPTPGELVVDLCAAPGGKAIHCAEKLQGDGIVLACDLSRRRLFKLSENACRLGIPNIHEVVMDGLSPAIGVMADLVVLDAPCSGTGVIGRKSDLRWNKNELDIARLAELQRELLHRATTLVKPGGRLLYSTCSLEPEENIGVVSNFLKEHSNFLRLPIRNVPAQMITEAGDFHSLPQRDHIAGAYCALLGKGPG